MVYMSGSTRARHTSSITNLPTCGGDKKGGLAPTGTSFSYPVIQIALAQQTPNLD